MKISALRMFITVLCGFLMLVKTVNWFGVLVTGFLSGFIWHV